MNLSKNFKSNKIIFKRNLSIRNLNFLYENETNKIKSIILTTLVLISTILTIISSHAQCHINDWTALKALYESTDGENWTYQKGWDSIIANQSSPEVANCNLDSLYGITLNNNGRVDTLSLSENQLSGSIPVELDKLSSLTFLSLSKNKLSGNIPVQLGNLVNLNKLYLYSNKLSGSIPKELGSLSNLILLYLYSNKLSDSIPKELGNLNQLEKLGLSSNQLSGSIPKELGNLANLTRLNLYNNDLTGNIPVELAKLNNLSELSLSSNEFSGGIPIEFDNLSNLTELFLSSNELSGNIPVEIGNLSKLTILSLHSNQLNGNIPKELGNLNNLTELNLSKNEIEGSIPVELGNLNNLTLLSLSQNKIKGSIPAELGNLSKLNKLYLWSNGLSGSIPEEVGGLNNLTELSFTTNGLTGSIPKTLANLDKLTLLYLGMNDLNGEIPVELGSLSKLTDLDLSSNQLNGSIPQELGNLNNLDELYLNNNQLSGSIPLELGNLTNLRELLLSNNQLSGSIPPELGNLSNLRELHLFNNQLSGCYDINLLNLSAGTNTSVSDGNSFDATWKEFKYNLDGSGACHIPDYGNCQQNDSITLLILNLTNSDKVTLNEYGCVTHIDLSSYWRSGNIPLKLGNLSELTYLDLSGNDYSGNIPPELGNLTNLTYLDLSGNELSGSIPHELSNLTSLKHLDLNFNELSDSIPPKLGNLTNLTYLDLRWNELSDSIPPELGNSSNLTDLKLNNNKLSGSIPPELGNLSKLADLSLYNNELNGNIPVRLKNLSNLSVLWLSGNQLSGSIPSELGNLANLTVLRLSSNELSGSIPSELGNLSKLTDLVLTNNQLSGSIPAELGSLSSLTDLSLSDNQLNGNIPPELGNMSNLNDINLSSNQLSGSIPPKLSNLGNLIDLDFSSNQLSGSIPTELGNLSKLKYLYLDNNQLSGSLPAELGKLIELKYLHLDNNQLSGVYPSELFSLCDQLSQSSRKIDDFNNFEITWDKYCTWGDHAYVNVCDFNDWTALKALYESTNSDNWKNRSGWDALFDKTSTRPSNCNLRTLYGVELDSLRVIKLNFAGNQLSGSLPPELGNLIELTDLKLTNNELSSNIPSKLGDLSNLKSLMLNDNELNGNIPLELGKLSNLTRLNLNGNQLTGIPPAQLSNLNNLENLYLQNNQLSGIYPSELLSLCDQISNSSQIDENNNFEITWDKFCRWGEYAYENVCDIDDWTALKALYESTNGNNWIDRYGWDTLFNNQNTRPPNCNLRTLYGVELDSFRVTKLNLDRNELNGSIPPELGKLSNLTVLELWINELSGSLPPELGDLSNLTVLELHDNQLSGSIPSELGDLSNLTDVKLKNNQLSGTIPSFNSNINKLNLSRNFFDCTDISTNFELNDQITTFIYQPQYFTPIEYENLQSTVITSLGFDQPFTIDLELPLQHDDDFSYVWWRNKTESYEYDYSWWGGEDRTTNVSFETNGPSFTIDNFQPNNTGKYSLEINTENCLPNGRNFEMISEPIYVIAEGYDLLGRPVEYDQIMVEFFDKDETERFERDVLRPNAGWVAEACNCNREIYLWQFPSTNAAVKALVEIDRKEKKGKKKSKIKGGFNNLLSVGEKKNNSKAVTIKNDSLDKIYPHNALVFLLDSGLDHQDFDATTFLIDEAPVDHCYGIESAPGYAYIDSTNINTPDTIIPISTNYTDNHWHGTFGFHSITSDLNKDHNIKIVPIKIFNEKGEGNLFDLTCGLYHSIDHEADVINISAGYQGQPSDILENAIFLAKEKGIFITTAAGNDSINIDSLPQYPAWYAGKYNTIIDENRNIEKNTLQYDHVISVVSLDESDNISKFSNFGKQSATLAAYGEKMHSYGPEGLDIVASGTSMATYSVTKELALEIASNRNRTQAQIWKVFKENRLISNNSIKTLTSTGKQLKVKLEDAVIYGCTDPNSCNYFEYVTDDDGTCEYNSCKCDYADWAALKAFYKKTDGDNWKRNNNWDIVKLDSISPDCNLENLYGVQLNEDGRVAEINLYNNNLTGNIPKELKGLSELNSLYLAANNLTGEIPAEFSEFIYMENLILSGNYLSGPIPFQLGELTKLKRLYLSYNKLNGEIPVQLHQLIDLEYLLLDNNELEGKLPPELALLSNLYHLNISNNQLSGCYESDLTSLCDQSPHIKKNANISDGNNFDAEWDSFCKNAEGVCVNNKNLNIEINELNVYPNPTKGKLVIEILNTDHKSKIFNIFNLEGKHLLQINGNALSNNLFELDLSEFSKGVYFIEMKTDSNNYIQKFILE